MICDTCLHSADIEITTRIGIQTLCSFNARQEYYVIGKYYTASEEIFRFYVHIMRQTEEDGIKVTQNCVYGNRFWNIMALCHRVQPQNIVHAHTRTLAPSLFMCPIFLPTYYIRALTNKYIYYIIRRLLFRFRLKRFSIYDLHQFVIDFTVRSLSVFQVCYNIG